MAQPAPHHLFTFADYLQIEEESGVRHELVGEMIVAMAGGSPEHAALGANVSRLLGNALAGKAAGSTPPTSASASRRPGS